MQSAGESGPSASENLLKRAQDAIPGGVNSPVRSFRSVGMPPLIAARGAGSRLWDVDGREYIDYVMSYGPLIFGHAFPEVTAAIRAACVSGTTFGATTEAEIDLAELIRAMVPSIDKVRLVNSGTEAVMSAVRVARGFTGRSKIIKFEGCYHGHSDGLLAKAGSGVATLSLPDSSGVPESMTRETMVLPYNDTDRFAELIRAQGVEIAAVLVEPVAANMGVVPPKPGFLEALRELTLSAGTVLIFDEIISGFRLAAGGAQELYGIAPDLTTLGKIAGGGMPLAAYGGRAEIMEMVAPIGPVYQAGTLSGNPVAVATGLAVLRKLQSDWSLYPRLAEQMKRLCALVGAAAEKAKVPITINSIGSIATVFFAAGPVTDFATANLSDRSAYARFFGELYRRGVFLAPSQFEAMFVSAAHTEGDIDATASAIAESLNALAS